MKINPAQQTAATNYKLLTNLIVPRPIAWVTTVSDSGVVNLAPFSFFNAVSSEPLQLVISVGTRDDDSQKDTAKNIHRSGEFVVNMVTEELMTAMNISAAEFPAHTSELEATGLHAQPSEKIAVPRVAESKVSFECVLRAQLTVGVNTLFVGEVVMLHVTDELLSPKLHINGFAPIGRMGSPSTYCRTADRFELPRMSYEQFVAQKEKQADLAAFVERADKPIVNIKTLFESIKGQDNA
jgi:flavin reductase (DIM6/NTAB) family NADH-FMN oxidoreductase RutF